jgi:hypothetical protein
MVWAELMWLRMGAEIAPLNAWACMATVLFENFVLLFHSGN